MNKKKIRPKSNRGQQTHRCTHQLFSFTLKFNNLLILSFQIKKKKPYNQIISLFICQLFCCVSVSCYIFIFIRINILRRRPYADRRFACFVVFFTSGRARLDQLTGCVRYPSASGAPLALEYLLLQLQIEGPDFTHFGFPVRTIEAVPAGVDYEIKCWRTMVVRERAQY